MDATPSRAPADFVPASPPGDDQRVTPLMEQYVEIKAANPGCLLFYRMGDFYELFFEDAEVASRALGIVLTKRGKHRGQDIPMCGVPVHRADEYLHRLIAQGHRVAVCEQTEDPAEAKKRGAHCLATVCPLCQFNLDAYHAQVRAEYGDVLTPAVYFTQLMGLAFGLPEEKLGLNRAAIPFLWRPAQPGPAQKAVPA